MRRLLIPAIPALAALALAGCTVKGTAVDNTPAGTVKGAKAGASTAAEAPDAPSTAKFGAGVKYPDGIVVSAAKPVPFKASGTAAGAKAGVPNVLIKITVSNGTKDTFDPALFSATVTTGADGEQAEQVYDSEKSINGCSLNQKILAGRKATVSCVWSVPTRTNLQLQVQADMTHDSAVFTA